MLRHEPFLEEAARRGAEHPLGQDPLVGYLTLHAVDHAIQFGPESIPARHVAEKVFTEVLLLPDESPCKRPYFWVLDSVRRGTSWEAITVRLTQLADALEREGRYREAEDVFRTLNEVYELPGVAALCGEASVVAAFLGCARTLRKQAHFEAAQQWYDKARERAHGANLHDLEVSARVGVARLALERGNYPEAKRVLDALQRHFVGICLSPHSRGSMLHEMGAATKFSDPVQAVRLFWDAFEIYDSTLDREYALYDVANGLLELGYVVPARKAFEVLERHGTTELVGIALRSLLELSWKMRDRVLFQRVWAKLSERSREVRPRLWAESLLYAGNALRAFGETDEGARLLREGQGIAAKYSLNEVMIRADEFLAAAQEHEQEEIAPPVTETNDAIYAVWEAVDSLWHADSLVRA